MWAIDDDDLIEATCWIELADHVYEGGDLPPSGVVFTRAWHGLAEFLARAEAETERRYILITADCDYGPVRQAQDETYKGAFRFRKDGHPDPGGGPPVRTRHLRDAGRCDPTHRFALKQRTRTHLTFDAVPDCVHKWFSVNVGVDDGIFECIPLGIQEGETELINATRIFQRRNILYLNFTVSNPDRRDILHYFHHRVRWWASVFGPEKPRRDEEQYLIDLAEHDFTCAPPGDGLDSYRLWQAIYSGSVPILFASNPATRAFARRLEGLPILVCSDLRDLTENNLKRHLKAVRREPRFSHHKASRRWWAERIDRAARDCGARC